jgi:hypothetical protein
MRGILAKSTAGINHVLGIGKTIFTTRRARTAGNLRMHGTTIPEESSQEADQQSPGRTRSVQLFSPFCGSRMGRSEALPNVRMLRCRDIPGPHEANESNRIDAATLVRQMGRTFRIWCQSFEEVGLLDYSGFTVRHFNLHLAREELFLADQPRPTEQRRTGPSTKSQWPRRISRGSHKPCR